MEVEHEFITIICGYCGLEVSIPVYCGNRFCCVCSVHRNAAIRSKLSHFVEKHHLQTYESFKFLTLTIKNEPDLKQMTDNLLLSFRRLRQRKFWKKHVDGGAFVIEVTHNPLDWHVHLHMIISGKFVPQDQLVTEWMTVSTGRGVYIKKIHSSQVLRYLTKYLTKDDVSESDQRFMSAILKGRRLFQPFGSWHKPISQAPKYVSHCPACERSAYWYFNLRQYYRSLIPDDSLLYQERASPDHTPAQLVLSI